MSNSTCINRSTIVGVVEYIILQYPQNILERSKWYPTGKGGLARGREGKKV